MSAIKEHDMVRLKDRHPAYPDLTAGTTGVVVYTYPGDDTACGVEIEGRVVTCRCTLLEVIGQEHHLKIVMDCTGTLGMYGDNNTHECDYAVITLTKAFLEDLAKQVRIAQVAKAADDSFTSLVFNDHTIDVYSHYLDALLEHALTEEEYEEFDSDDWFVIPSRVGIESRTPENIELPKLHIHVTDRGSVYFGWEFYPSNAGNHVTTAELPYESVKLLFEQSQADAGVVVTAAAEAGNTRDIQLSD